MSIITVDGDLLRFSADVIVQQTNCLTINSQGLAKNIATRFGIDVYEKRQPVFIKDNNINSVAFPKYTEKMEYDYYV